MAYPIREWIRMERTTVTTVIRILFPRECQKSVTSMASAKLLKLQVFGSDRMPEMLFPSLEGFGIDVASLAAKAGLTYNGGENTVTYFGMLLY